MSAVSTNYSFAFTVPALDCYIDNTNDHLNISTFSYIPNMPSTTPSLDSKTHSSSPAPHSSTPVHEESCSQSDENKPTLSPSILAKPSLSDDFEDRVEKNEVDNPTLISSGVSAPAELRIEGRAPRFDRNKTREATELPNYITSAHFTTDVSAKRAGIFHKFKPLDDDPECTWFTPNVPTSSVESIVMYELGERDSSSRTGRIDYEFSVRNIKVVDESDNPPTKLVAKQSQMWDRNPNLSCHEAAELVQANRYASKMLRCFKANLMTRWRTTRQSNPRRSAIGREWHAKSLGLMIIGPLMERECGWMIVDAPTHSDTTRYVMRYNFGDHQDPEDPFNDLIHCFIHNTYHVSGGTSLISNLECDIEGNIYNIDCFSKEPPKYRYVRAEDVQVASAAFDHFRREHKCNNICRWMGLLPL
ncbi:hypothetical protein DFH28DRAFT_1122538 [Melampsora americana]|nr:hypothetical protein DFH28DRAFT_1122538 [Melampsora americana]